MDSKYFSRHRPQKGAEISFQIVENNGHNLGQLTKYLGRVAWVRKSRRLDGLCLVGVELGLPLNIWDSRRCPGRLGCILAPGVEDPIQFSYRGRPNPELGPDRELLSAFGRRADSFPHRTKAALLHSRAPISSGSPHGSPGLDPTTVIADGGSDEAYKTLSDDEAKKEYDSNLARRSKEDLSDARKQTQRYLNNAQECMAERNFAGCILWLHRAIESEPNIRAIGPCWGGACLQFPSTAAEAVEQFEMAIELDPRNVAAHFYYRGIARTDERALAGAVTLSSRFGTGRESLGIAAAPEPIVGERPARIVEAVSPGPAYRSPLSTGK